MLYEALIDVGLAARNLETRHKCESSLIEFLRYVWPVVEPATEFIDGWAIQAIADHLQAVTEGHIRRLLINVPPGFSKSLLTSVAWPTWEWGPRNLPHMRYICASYSHALTERDNLRSRNIVLSDRYRAFWGDRFEISADQFTKIKFANSKTGWKLATSVGGLGVGERGDRFICDDPNQTMEVESEVARATSNMWFTEVVPDRLNNQQKSAIVVIQQRLHEDDISGTAISREMGYTHLMIPMEHDPARHCVTSIGWEDPRTEEGELAWPERFPQSTVEELKRDKNKYAFCTPAESPVVMADTTLRPIGQIRVGDEILGFRIGNAERRARLEKTKVLSISRSRQHVVKMTMESGEIVRCTPDHKWWTRRNDEAHPPYLAAKVGSVLSRLCPSRLEKVSEGDEHLAGWLSGFFDGEGTVSINHKRETDPGSSLIGFSQGDGRNRPLCDKLEYALDRFGFPWSVWKKPTRAKDGNHSMRFYWLKAGENGRESRFALYQKFLHIVQPVKWKQRIVDTTTGGRLYTKKDIVTNIQYDGEETVYGLETTTGNYFVWGLASSNSGQYQQSPEPRGGSIIRREFWKLWEDEKYPPFEYILASADTAYTAKEENDPSALTIWGLFRDPRPLPVSSAMDLYRSPSMRIMLIWAWQGRLEFNDLVQEFIETCTTTPLPRERLELRAGRPRFPVNCLLIENKASGLSVGQEMWRLLSTKTTSLSIQFPNLQRGYRYTQDKVARMHSVQHIFADGLVYAPDRSWADMVINQASIFPKGSHDDLCDTVSQCLRFMRDSGMLAKPEENAIYDEQDVAYPAHSEPLYLPYR